ncbi:MAG TPA: hypothetical protein PKA61_15540 [Nitrospira sp.]|nr:hypothetical protein [Nitrospira sp.]
MKEPDLDWLVHNRSAVQELLLELWKEFPETPSADSQPGAALQLLVGATFSLWRAAFLAESPRDWQEHASHAKKFLYLVVKEQTMGHVQEREARYWTVGYYLTSAFLRLESAYVALDYDPPLRSIVTRFIVRRGGMIDEAADPRTPWETAAAAVRDLLGEARRRLAGE